MAESKCSADLILAQVRSTSWWRVGRSGVEAGVLDEVVQVELTHLEGDVDPVLIDEVGKMELFSSSFVGLLPRLLDDPAPVVATVARNGPGLIAQAKARQDVQLSDVSRRDRNRLPE